MRVHVTGKGGEALADAVVTLRPSDDAVEVEAAGPERAVLAQRDYRFVPFVLPVSRGSVVMFPNHDDTRHHVYSFSPAKTFEIKLYRGDPEKVITFDRTGVVAVGCNIHDYMQAFIYVTDVPRFGKSGDDGSLTFHDLEPGEWTAEAWHPWQQGALPPRTVLLAATGETEVAFDFDLSLPPPRRPEGNALQQWIEDQ